MHEHSNYQLLNVKTGKEQPFSTMRQAIDAADKHKVGSYRIVELKPDGSKITRIEVST